MAGQIRMTPNQIRSRATEFRTEGQNCEAIITRMQNLIDNLQEEWEDRNTEGFSNQFEQLKPSFRKMCDLIDDIARQLDDTARSMKKPNKKNIMMDTKGKLFDLLEKDTLSADEYRQVCLLSTSPDTETRQLVAELLGVHYTTESEKILRKLLLDQEDLVKVEAVDSLIHSENPQVMKQLVKVIKEDTSWMVRGHALSAYGEIYTKINHGEFHKDLARFIKNIISHEQSMWVKTICFRYLCSCGDPNALEQLISCLNQEDYRIRSVAVENLVEILNDDNVEMIQQKVKKYYDKEPDGFIRKKMRAILLYHQEPEKSISSAPEE